MNLPLPFTRVLFCAVISLLLATVPAFHADAKAPAGSGKKSATKADNPETLKKKLEDFGKGIAESYNRCVLPNINKKEVTKNDNGTFTAKYQAIDPQSIEASFKPAIDPKSPVKYIGTLLYAEVTYTCTAPTREEALKGPFAGSRAMTTELVKYVNGKWSY